MHLWLIEAIAGICALIGIQYGIKKFILHCRKSSTSHPHDWREKLDHIAYLPLSILIWVVGAVYVVDIVGPRLGFSTAIVYLNTLRKAAVVACLAWLFFRWKNEFQRSVLLTKTKKVDAGIVQVVGRLSTISILILAGLVILQIFDVNIAPLLAFGSIGAASIGFAGKDVIANFCSGIMLNITRPFIVGDQILLPEKNLEGFIEEIGWFRTSIRDKEKRAVYLPNNFFSTQLVINISRMTHRHLKQKIRIPFKNIDAIENLTGRIKEILNLHHRIDSSLPIHAHLYLFGDSFAEIEIEAYCIEISQDGFYKIEQEILLLIYRELEKSGVELAVPEVRLRNSGSALFELQQLDKS